MQIGLIPLTTSSETQELSQAIQRAEMEAIDYQWDSPLEILAKADAYVLLADSPQPFDQTKLADLITLLLEADQQGKPILGLGYAATLLANHGLIPGLYKNWVGLSVQPRKRPRSCQLRLSPNYQFNAFTRLLTTRDRWSATSPAELEFVIPPGLLTLIQEQGLDVIWFCEGDEGIAALANKTGNVMAMLVYPENGPTGDAIFNSLREHLSSGHREILEPLCYWPRPPK